MSTFGAMQDRIADELARTDLTSQISKAIQSSIRHYERERFYFNETIGTFSTVASQEWYSSSDFSAMPNIAEIDSVRITVGSNIYRLIARDFSYLEEINLSTSHTGDPTDFCYYRQQMRFWPIPSAVRTITIAYVARPATLSASTDTNAWMTDAEEMVRSRAKADIYGHVLRDTERAGVMMQFAKGVHDQMQEETTHRSASRRVRSTSF
jgi:hypothetical protein